MKALFAAAATLLLGGCATLHIDSQTVERCDPGAKASNEAQLCRMSEEGGLIPPDEAKRVYAGEGLDLDGETIGLALGGGGSKAGPVAMGALAGLEEAGVLEHVDAISSVSGGGYAAYFYMRELMNLQGDGAGALEPGDDVNQAVAKLFEDCVPRAQGYAWITGVPEYSGDLSWQERHGVRCGEKPEIVDNATYAENYGKLTAYLDDGNPYAAQVAVRYQQDLLSAKYDFINSGTAGFRRLILDGRYLVGDVAELVAGHAVMFPADTIMNQIFDVNSELSPSKHSYRVGIRDTYGAFNYTCGRAFRFKSNPEVDCPKEFEKGNDFAQLAVIRDRGCSPDKPCRPIPLWIANTTSGYSLQPFLVADFGELSTIRDSFEITSYGFGSGEYGYYAGEPPMNMLTAVTTSGAFFDSQAKNYGQPFRGISGAWMSSLGLNWGEDIANPRVSDAERAFHRFMPWPLYWAHGFTRDRHSVDIHLSDGGQSENLGIYALLRRHIKNIIIVDAPEDAEGTMDSLCQVKNELAGWEAYKAWADGKDDAKHAPPISIRFPDLTGLYDLCKQTGVGYDIHHWSMPVVFGCAVELAGLPRDFEGPAEYRREIQRLEEREHCTDSGGHKVVSKLFLIKPAFDEAWVCASDASLRSLVEERRQSGAPVSLKKCLESGFPAETAMFLLAEADAAARDGVETHCPIFPQDKTVNITANSDGLVYGAYRELTRYLSKHLRWSANELAILDASGTAQKPPLGPTASAMSPGARSCSLI